MIARYQGGDNAGHTIVIDGKKFKLHLIPSGIFFPEKISVIGNGMVVNPKSLVKELSYLHEEGVTTDNLRISDRAHVILPYHIELDRLQEEAKGDNKMVLQLKELVQLIWIRLLVWEFVSPIFWIKTFSVSV